MKIEREQELESSVLRVPRWCVMAQRGGNTDVGIRCPLRPIPIPSTAITYNNDGLVEPVGDLTSAGKREKEGRYRGVGRTLYIRVYGRERKREKDGWTASLLLFLTLFRTFRRYRESRERRIRRTLEKMKILRILCWKFSSFEKKKTLYYEY